MLEKLIKAGMNVARCNCTHGTVAANEANIRACQKARQKTKSALIVALDTKGPDIRIGFFEGPNPTGSNSIIVKEGQLFTFHTKEVKGTSQGVYVNYIRLPQVVKVGQELRINDGLVLMTVEKVTDTEVIARVNTDGVIKDKKSLAVPGCDLKLPFLSKLDEEDLIMGCKNKVDWILASFVGSAKDVLEMKAFMKKHGGEKIKIISKIESVYGVENLDEILKVSEGIIVARGDLGIEYPVEQIPNLQKMIVEKTRAAGKIIIVATEMLESMIDKPRPTRAETTDVANAVWDGSEYVWLSAESATGKYPVQCVQYLARISAEAEKHKQYFRI